MSSNYKIETENLILRPFSLEDVNKVFKLSQEEGMRQWIPDQVYEDEEETVGVLKFLMAQYEGEPNPKEAPFILGVTLKETGELIGNVGLSPLGDDVEIGYAIGEEYQGNGYATESIIAITKWALKEIELGEILGIVDSKNQASWRALEKSEFEFIEESKREAFGRNDLCRVYKIQK